MKAGQVSQKENCGPLGDAEDRVPSPEAPLSLCLGLLPQKADYIPKPLGSVTV